MARLDVLVVGLGFGRHFVPIYQAHPKTGRVGVVEPDDSLRGEVVVQHRVTEHYRSLDEALAGSDWDAVHIVSPVRFHHEQVSQVLRSGRHVASAVPMATSLDDLADLVDLADHAPGGYQMMETALYTREYFAVRELRDLGRLGRITYGTGEHLQNLDGFPHYWLGYPSMHYATHAVAPLLGLSEGRVFRVRCVGSSALAVRRHGDFGPGFGVETALMEIEGNPLLADAQLTVRVTTSFFQLGRAFQESFNLYGDRGGVEWPQVSHDPMVVFDLEDEGVTGRGRSANLTRFHPPTRLDLLPEPLHPFADGDHGGSHPHLVHAFIGSLAEGRPLPVDARMAARITAPGICAHASAMRGGEAIDVPNW